MKNRATMTLITISRHELSERYLTGRLPVLVVDGLADWPVMQRWSPETLMATFGDTPVWVSISASGYWRYHPDGSPIDPASDTQERLPFAEAAKLIARDDPAGPKYYVNQWHLSEKFSDLLGELRFPIPISASRVNLWFGSGGTVTPFHFDRPNNLFAQVYGAKQFTLFPPEDTSCLYPYPIDCALPHVSPIDVDHPDLTRYPRYAEARPISVTVHAGQLLVLPAFWWHHVRSLGVSISVNQWSHADLRHYTGDNALRLLRHEYTRNRWIDLRKTLREFQGDDPAGDVMDLCDLNPCAAALALAVLCDDQIGGDPDGAPLLTDAALHHAWQRLVQSIVDSGQTGESADRVRSLCLSVREALGIPMRAR